MKTKVAIVGSDNDPFKRLFKLYILQIDRDMARVAESIVWSDWVGFGNNSAPALLELGIDDAEYAHSRIASALGIRVEPQSFSNDCLEMLGTALKVLEKASK